MFNVRCLDACTFSILAVAIIGAAPLALADHGGIHDWQRSDGGSFYGEDEEPFEGPTENWEPNAAPGPDDIARFNLGASELYIVTFDDWDRPNAPGIFRERDDPESDQLLVLHDQVRMDLFGTPVAGSRTYALGSTGSGADASLVVGQGFHTELPGIPTGNFGRLTLMDRGTLAGHHAVIGRDAGLLGGLFPWRSRGELRLRHGATAEFSERVIVGDAGTGELIIEDGGFLPDNYASVESGSLGQGAILGAQPGGVGEATVAGRWDIDSWMVVGDAGTGTLTIESATLDDAPGGIVTTLGAGELGKLEGSHGSVKVTGSGAVWDVG